MAVEHKLLRVASQASVNKDTRLQCLHFSNFHSKNPALKKSDQQIFIQKIPALKKSDQQIFIQEFPSLKKSDLQFFAL